MFEIKSLEEYHDFYLKKDVLLLCDVFEKFIKTCLEYYSLDPSHYFSSPGLSWDVLKMAGIKLEKIHDIDIRLFIEKEMRGGISYISKRYAKADNNSTIMYWDANNLYGWAMIQFLPASDFKFLTKKEISKLCLNSIDENSSIGYILKCDLEYCKELHDLHNDYLLCLKKIEANSNKLSRYCSDIANKYGIKVGGVKKLIPNLNDKIKYVVHYKNLQYYLSLGIKFKQSNWLKENANFNTKKRPESFDELNKKNFKLLVNCVYGKSIENIRKRINVKLINDSKEYLKCVSKPNFISQKVFDKTFIAVHQIKSMLTLNKPINVGFCILELSKLLMYKFHYDYVLKRFNARMLFTDNDSLVYEIKDKNDSSNKKVLDKLRDEFNEIKISEFVGVKSKMYSLISFDDKGVNKAKGINKKLRHKEYHDVLFNKKVIRHNMKRIQSKLHEIGTLMLFIYH